MNLFIDYGIKGIDLRTHLLTLEYNYIKRNLVDRLTHLDLSKHLRF